MYNETEYNVARYNAEGVEISFSDSVSVTDAAIEKFLYLSFTEFIFADETITNDFTVKSLTDTIRLSDWLSIERQSSNNRWFD